MMVNPLWPLLWRIAVGGAVGSGLRYATGLALGTDHDFPWATLTVNIVGAFTLAVLVFRLLATDRPDAARLRALWGTGFLGGFTTYSALSGDLVLMLDVHRYAPAGAYAVSTLVGGFLAAVLGAALARRMRRAG